MNKIIDIQIIKYGRVYTFDAGDYALQRGDMVLVETELGPSMGVVCSESVNGLETWPEWPAKQILRPATGEDRERYEKNCRLEEDVYSFCYERIKVRSLPMSLVSVDRLFDGSKVMVYFTADGRVDFRELVKDLVQRFHTRIEMRQIGVRYQAKMVGGLGSCGRALCCSSFLKGFDPVSIRMAKEQNLSLNPSKISGMCGRLMCCLAYEYAFYEKAKKNVPKVGKRMTIPQGEGKVIRQNVLQENMTVLLDSGEEVDLSFTDYFNNKSSAELKNKRDEKRSNHRAL
ncbi:MAG: PSP1 domain-containing protein [Desulfatiglandales bacterium]